MPAKKNVLNSEMNSTTSEDQKDVKTPRKPKVKLVSYTLKAVIPTGQYSNIQPEITVTADTIQDAERFVMPYIEELFAKYRDGGIKQITAQAPIVLTPKNESTPAIGIAVPLVSIAVPDSIDTKVSEQKPAIVLSFPLSRAKKAVESCLGLDALKLVSDQIAKSQKLIESEKKDLMILVAAKHAELSGTKAV